MMFDFTINIGTIIELGTIIAGGLFFILTINTKLQILIVERKHEHASNIQKFDDIEEQLKKLIDITIRIATQEERINALEAKLAQLTGTSTIKSRRTR